MTEIVSPDASSSAKAGWVAEFRDKANGRLIEIVSLQFNFMALMFGAGTVLYILGFVRAFQTVLARNPRSEINPAASPLTWSFAAMLLCLIVQGLLEYPTGRYSDRVRHVPAIRTSFALFTIASSSYCLICFQTSGNFGVDLAGLVVAQLVIGVASALQSGSMHSWLVVSLREYDYRKSLTEFMARRRFYQNLGQIGLGFIFLLASSLGGKELDPKFLFLGSAFFMFLAFCSSLTLRSLDALPDQGEALKKSEPVRGRLDALVEIARSPRLLLVFLANLTFTPLTLTVGYYWIQILENPHFGNVRDRSVVFVIAWIIMNAGRLAGSEVAARIKARQQEDGRLRAFRLSEILITVPFIGAVVAHALGLDKSMSWIPFVAAFALSRFGQELAKPILLGWIHEDMRHEQNRATIESIIEAGGSIGFSILLLMIFVSATLFKGHGFGLNADETHICLYSLVVLSCVSLYCNMRLLSAEETHLRKGHPSGLI